MTRFYASDKEYYICKRRVYLPHIDSEKYGPGPGADRYRALCKKDRYLRGFFSCVVLGRVSKNELRQWSGIK